MVVTNMKELCEYVANKRKARSHQHAETIRIYGACRGCLLYTSPSPRDPKTSRMPSSA